MTEIISVPNSDLEVGSDNMSRWSEPEHRRRGWHHLDRIARYGMTLRASYVMQLEKCMDLRIANLESVRHYTSLPWFSAMVVVRGQQIIFERYAQDFGPCCLHSLQSITKTVIHLIVGQLVEAGKLDLNQPIAYYVPEIGTGYAAATIQEVLNMNVINDYTEDFADPGASYYQHEEAMGWRLPRQLDGEETQRKFIARITSGNTTNHSGRIQYKDANSDVLGWVAERASGRPLRAFLADIVDAAGVAEVFHITTDRDGVPGVDGGASMTARDLARYFGLLMRGGRGIMGRTVGSPRFLEQTLRAGIPMGVPFDTFRYSNHMMVAGRTVSHGGWGGQYAIANLETGVIGIFLSVIENRHAVNREYLGPIVEMLQHVTGPMTLFAS